MSHELEQEIKRLNAEAQRIESAQHNLHKVAPWIEWVDKEVRPIASVYAGRYSQLVAVTLDPTVVRSFNDGDFAEQLDEIRELLGVEPQEIQSNDSPETRCRSFVMKNLREGISMEYTLRAYLSEGDATCQIIVERVEEVETEKWIIVKESRPVLRFVCPKE